MEVRTHEFYELCEMARDGRLNVDGEEDLIVSETKTKTTKVERQDHGQTRIENDRTEIGNLKRAA